MTTVQTDVTNLGQQVKGLITALKTSSIPAGTQYEVEVRFRSYAQHLGISFRQFHLVQKFLTELGLSRSVSRTVDRSQPYRGGKFAKLIKTKNSDTRAVSYSIKRRLFTPIDNPQFNLRYAISEEIPLQAGQIRKFNPNNKRRKERYSYSYGNAYRVDMTNVNNGESFEMELEIVDTMWTRGEVYDKLPIVILQLLKVLYDTELIYTQPLYQTIVSFYNRTMQVGREEPGIINHKTLFQARNLNARDMVQGGLVGNSRYEYNVTIKADGERKLLVIHSTGIWLLIGPDRANWVYSFKPGDLEAMTTYTQRDPTGTILEGELIPENRSGDTRRLDKAPNTKYWFLIFDCLARSTDQRDVGDNSVQLLPHIERMRTARQAKTNLDGLAIPILNDGRSLLTVNTKDFFGFSSAKTMFEIIRRLERRKAIGYYPYKDDGYIFTANDMPYNAQSNYSGNQYIQVRWRRIGEQTWRNEHGSIIQLISTSRSEGHNLHSGPAETGYGSMQLVEQPPNSRVHKALSVDAEWYSTKSMSWHQTPSGVWQPNISDREWITTNPFTASRGALYGARKAREISDVIQIVDADLWQTIGISERGRKPISKIPLHLRTLTRYPDICKWKPPSKLTIDFAIIRHGEYIQLMVSGFDESLIPFTGTPHHPFITDPTKQPYGPIDHAHELTRTAVNKVTVIEYAWNFDSKNPMMIPIGIRSDKTRPNSMDIANAVWSDIQNPIDIQTMQGNTFRLMSKYHNRIKRQLFNRAIPTDHEYNLLDIGSGVGGDLLKVTRARRVVMVEPSDIHLPQLVKRLRSIFHQTNTQIILPTDDPSTVARKTDQARRAGHRVVIVQTGGEDSATITRVVNSWLGGPAQRLSLMLSLSFFWESPAHLDQLANTIRTNLAPDGLGVFLTIDGRIVKQAFNPPRLTHDTEPDVPILSPPASVSSPPRLSSASTYLSSDGSPLLSPSPTASSSSAASSSASSSSAASSRASSSSAASSSAASSSASSSSAASSSSLDYDITTLGGQRSDYDTIKIGTATLKYSNTEDSLFINIPDSIVTDQQEWLVYLDQLAVRLADRFEITSAIRADRESFMSGAEYRLSSMYTGGYIYPLGTDFDPEVKSRKLTKHSGSTRRPDVYASSSEPTISAERRPTTFPIGSDVSSTSGVIHLGVGNAPVISLGTERDSIVSGSVAGIAHNPIVASQSSTLTTQDSGSVKVTSPSRISAIRPAAVPVSVISAGDSEMVELPMLPIMYDSTNDVGIGDDAVEVLNVSWYKAHPVVRIATIADGSCFFHAVLKAFYEPYANNNNYTNRTTIIKRLRRDLAVSLSQRDPRDPTKTYYQTASNGQWMELSTQVALGVTLPFDPRPGPMEDLLNSMRDVGDEFYQYVSDMLQIDIYMMSATTRDLTLITKTEASKSMTSTLDTTSSSASSAEPVRERRIVVITGNGRHYETLGLKTGAGIQTVFQPSHPFIQAAIIGKRS